MKVGRLPRYWRIKKGQLMKEVLLNNDISVEEKVAFLKRSDIYPGDPSGVEVKETHMSWVFLLDDFVYKLKKPVAYQFLDFRTLASRFKDCQDEVKLNRRLAKEIYLGLVPLTVDEKGTMALKENGRIIDWLVKMKRIPEENLLDYGIRHRTINEIQLRRVARLLTEFYKASPGIEITSEDYRRKLKEDIERTHIELNKPEYDLPVKLLEKLQKSLLQYLENHPSTFDRRVEAGKIIEAHGDLRPEHICMAPTPAIIDCLEFNRELRIFDTAEELSFIAMECEILGNKFPGVVFFETYIRLTGDHLPESLIRFYKLKRACLRAFLVVRHIEEPAYKNDPKWLKKTDAYLQLAKQYEQKLFP